MVVIYQEYLTKSSFLLLIHQFFYSTQHKHFDWHQSKNIFYYNNFDLEKIGPKLETSSLYPERCNITLAKIENKKLILNNFPKVLRRVAGYNIDALLPDAMSYRPSGRKGDGINW